MAGKNAEAVVPAQMENNDGAEAELAYQMLKSELDNYTDRLVDQMSMRAQYSGVLAAMCLALMIFVLGTYTSRLLAAASVHAALVSILLVVLIERYSRFAFTSPDYGTIVEYIEEGNYNNAIAYSMNSAISSMTRVYIVEGDVRALWILLCITSSLCLIASIGVVFI